MCGHIHAFELQFGQANMWRARDTQLTLHINKYLFSFLHWLHIHPRLSGRRCIIYLSLACRLLVWCGFLYYQKIDLDDATVAPTSKWCALQHWNVYMLNCWSMIHLGYVCISVNFRRPVEYLVWWSMHVRLNFLSRGGQCWKIKLLLPLSQITIHFGFSNILVFAIHI